MNYEQILYYRRSIESSLKKLIPYIKDLETASLLIKTPDILTSEKEKIRSRLYTYLLNGYNYQYAKNRLSIEFQTTDAYISKVCDQYYLNHIRQLRPMKIYAAKILKAAGHTNRQIAALLDITPQTVTKYLLLANRR